MTSSASTAKLFLLLFLLWLQLSPGGYPLTVLNAHRVCVPWNSDLVHAQPLHARAHCITKSSVYMTYSYCSVWVHTAAAGLHWYRFLLACMQSSMVMHPVCMKNHHQGISILVLDSKLFCVLNEQHILMTHQRLYISIQTSWTQPIRFTIMYTIIPLLYHNRNNYINTKNSLCPLCSREHHVGTVF